VPPLEANAVARIAYPLLYALAVVRTVIIAALAALYLVLVSGACTLLVRQHPPSVDIVSLAQAPVPPIYRAISYVLTALLSRLSLFVLGVWWIRIEQMSRKRGYVLNPW
jgi:hypothetical protein